jgi:hypothetical protein
MIPWGAVASFFGNHKSLQCREFLGIVGIAAFSFYFVDQILLPNQTNKVQNSITIILTVAIYWVAFLTSSLDFLAGNAEIAIPIVSCFLTIIVIGEHMGKVGQSVSKYITLTLACCSILMQLNHVKHDVHVTSNDIPKILHGYQLGLLRQEHEVIINTLKKTSKQHDLNSSDQDLQDVIEETQQRKECLDRAIERMEKDELSLSVSQSARRVTLGLLDHRERTERRVTLGLLDHRERTERWVTLDLLDHRERPERLVSQQEIKQEIEVQNHPEAKLRNRFKIPQRISRSQVGLVKNKLL